MKNKNICLGYINQVSVIYILQMFNESAVSGPAEIQFQYARC
jgi:hypothetical protein